MISYGNTFASRYYSKNSLLYFNKFSRTVVELDRYKSASVIYTYPYTDKESISFQMQFYDDGRGRRLITRCGTKNCVSIGYYLEEQGIHLNAKVSYEVVFEVLDPSNAILKCTLKIS